MKPNKKSKTSSKNTPQLSIIIPTFNSWKTLRDCLDSIKKQTAKIGEVIVVDNASSDQTEKFLKKFKNDEAKLKVKIIKNERNLGVSGGRNAGIQSASKSADVLLFVDHDMVLAPNLIEELLKVSKSNEDIGIVTPKIYYSGDKKRIWAAGTNIDLLTGQVLFRGGLDRGQFDQVKEVQVAPACFLVKKEVINRIHLFDERYFATFEDTDFCFRARIQGFKTIYAPLAVAYHQISSAGDDDADRLLSRSFFVARNKILFMGQYGENFWLFLFFSPIYIFYFLILALKRQNLRGFKNYLEGYLAGITEELLAKRVLVHLPFSIYNSQIRLIGKGKQTILDVGCGDGRFMGILISGKPWRVSGIDLYKPDVLRAQSREIYQEVILGDVRKVEKFFTGKKFDAILCASVFDHLTKKEALDLLSKFEKMGKEIIISGLPNGFEHKHEAYFFEGANPHQVHKSAWSIEDFTGRDYIVRGIGVKFLMGEDRLSGKKFWSLSQLLQPIRWVVIFFENLLAYLLSPLSFYNPNMSLAMFAYKEVKSK